MADRDVNDVALEKLEMIRLDIQEIKNDTHEIRRIIFGDGNKDKGILSRLDVIEKQFDWLAKSNAVWFGRVVAICTILVAIAALVLSLVTMVH